MDKKEFFDLIWRTIAHSQIVFEEFYVGDEEDGQVYYLFKNINDDNKENTYMYNTLSSNDNEKQYYDIWLDSFKN
jgi:hypothetical protein